MVNKMVYKRRRKNKLWSKEIMAQAVNAVLVGRMGYSLASRTFSVPKTTLERKVKKARLLKTPIEEPPTPLIHESIARSTLERKLGQSFMTQPLEKEQPLVIDELADLEIIPEVSIKYELDDETECFTINEDLMPVSSVPVSSDIAAFHKKNPQVNNRMRNAETNCRSILDDAMPCTQFEQASYNSSFASPPLPLDAIEHLFLGFAKTIKSFSSRRQILTKMHVSQYIMQQELKQREEEEYGNGMQ